jgi:TRAP-type transport system small permease protein
MIRRLAVLLEQVAVVSMLLMTFFILVIVFGRNLFSAGLPWAEELARYCSIALVFLGAPLLLADKAHIAVDFVVSALPPSRRALVEKVSLFAVAVFCGLFLFAGWEFIARAYRFATPALGIPNWLFYLPVFIGVLMTGVVALAEIVSPTRTPPHHREEQAP